MTPIRLGVLGAGFAAQTLALAVARSKLGRIVTVWSPSVARREALATSTGARAVQHPSAAMVDVDAVVIATPHQTHAALATAALDAGRHVFCEKPLTTSTEEGERLVALAGRRGLVLSVNHFQRYRRPNAAVRRTLLQGRIGAPVGGQSLLLEVPMSNQWQHEASSVGFLLGYGVHAVDLLQWWLASPIVEVSARTSSEDGVERTTATSLLFATGAVISLISADRTPFASAQVGRAMFTTTLVGDRGLVHVDSYDAATLVTDTATVLDKLPSWTDKSSPERLEAYVRAFDQFAASVRTGVALELSASDALSAVRVCLAAIESGRRRGRSVCV